MQYLLTCTDRFKAWEYDCVNVLLTFTISKCELSTLFTPKIMHVFPVIFIVATCRTNHNCPCFTMQQYKTISTKVGRRRCLELKVVKFHV